MILSKSKIYESRLITLELKDKKIEEIYLKNMYQTTTLRLTDSSEEGYEKLIHFFIFKGANDWNSGMDRAIVGGHEKLVDFFIHQGADDWNWGMICAAEKNRLDIIQFFISKGADDWNWGIHWAALGGS